ncbi:hypothetical protein TNCT_97201 [Trichonephila clavata]|uniref:Uncharacterized protein n=1 Tax=Trichonephila clavata TaxID=2740835 RepID=A0A8X6HX99_TRICU|nr:hypothetical protein TNCT_97201 [Trichonephila clavata]
MSISDDSPTVVSQQGGGPFPLKPFFHVGNIPKKTFGMLITDFYPVIRKGIQMRVKTKNEVIFFLAANTSSKTIHSSQPRSSNQIYCSCSFSKAAFCCSTSPSCRQHVRQVWMETHSHHSEKLPCYLVVRHLQTFSPFIGQCDSSFSRSQVSQQNTKHLSFFEEKIRRPDEKHEMKSLGYFLREDYVETIVSGLFRTDLNFEQDL